jgi:AraC-like DNA-binding protein
MVAYLEAPPPPDLAGVLACVWSLRGGRGPGGPERVLSDGTVEIVFRFGDPFRRHDADGRAREQPARLLVGPLGGHVRIEPTGRIDVLGLRVLPGAAATLLRTPLRELRDLDVDLDAAEHQLPRDLHERLAVARTVAERFELAVEAVRRAARHERRSAAVGAACRALSSFPRAATVEDAAARLGVGRRTLERMFRDHVGLSPKRLQRILRLQAAMRAVRAGASIAAAAVDAGYYDQSHLALDCRELAGATPRELFAAQKPLEIAFASGA